MDKNVWHLRLTCVEAANFWAKAGSMAIISSRFSAMAAFRTSICSATQSLKVSPRTAVQMLTTHYFGIFGRSGSSGR